MAPYPDDELPSPPPWADQLAIFRKHVDDMLSILLTKLLQEKHVYQSVGLAAEDVLNRLCKSLEDGAKMTLRSKAMTWLNVPWVIEHFDRSAAPPLNDALDPKPFMTLQPVEIVCYHCKRRTAHVPITWSDNTSRALERRMVVRREAVRPVQIWTFVYQCQACHSHPTAFLVARDGDRLRLEGRSPIELVEVPKHIPEQEARFFRDAIVAHSTGRTLAGLFYLRTLIEQFARRVTAITGRATGDEIMQTYGETIPSDLRARIPSLKEWYDRLSAALHSADDDAKLFQEAHTQIAKHFDIRRALDIA